MIRNINFFFPFVFMIVTILTGGCNDKMGGTYPLSVKVTRDGTPVAGATVVLGELSGSQAAVGITNASGVATIKSTDGWGGAFPGEYGVAINKTERSTTTTPPPGTEVSSHSSSGNDDAPAEEQVYAVSREVLPAKYGNAKTSGLKLSHANKKETFEFDLSSNP